MLASSPRVKTLSPAVSARGACTRPLHARSHALVQAHPPREPSRGAALPGWQQPRRTRRSAELAAVGNLDGLAGAARAAAVGLDLMAGAQQDEGGPLASAPPDIGDPAAPIHTPPLLASCPAAGADARRRRPAAPSPRRPCLLSLALVCVLARHQARQPTQVC